MEGTAQTPYWLSRTALILGAEKLEFLAKSRVMVAGLGGVGGICAEMIVRSGVGHLTIVDNDVVEESNLNRQIVATREAIGERKAEIMKKRLLGINPQMEINAIHTQLKDEKTREILAQGRFDLIIDCIDQLSSKVYLLKHCADAGIPVVSSLGAGGKLNPGLIRIADISETYQCNLARYVRKKLHSLGIKNGITTVFSPEVVNPEAIVTTEQAYPKKSIIGTISYIPNIFGCMAAGEGIRILLNGFENTTVYHPSQNTDSHESETPAIARRGF